MSDESADLITFFRQARAIADSAYPGCRRLRLLLETSDGQDAVIPIPVGRLPAPVAVGPPAIAGRSHSSDYRTINWDAVTYRLSPTQAAVVRALWEAAENGTPEVGQAALLEAADSESSRLVDVFRRCPAWGKIIAPGDSPGTFRLGE